MRVLDFDMLRRRVNVSRSVTESGGLQWSTPKSWERRSVPFPTALTEGLAALMTGKARDDLVFTDLRGGVLRNSNWRARVFRPAVAKCRDTDDAFPAITPHDLRHTVSQSRRQCAGQREGRAADVGTCEGFDDSRHLRRPVRRRPRRSCGPPERRHPSYCGRSADGGSSLAGYICPELLKLCGAKGNRTPDLLDANESRYQLRHSP